MIVRRAVTTDSTPVNRLGCEVRIGTFIEDVRVMLLRVREVFLHERDASESHLEKHLELVFREIALEPVTFLAIGIRDDDGRRPGYVKAMKIFRVFFDVNAQRNEILVDE